MNGLSIVGRRQSAQTAGAQADDITKVKTCLVIRLFRIILKRLETLMSDFSNLNAAVADLSAKVDAFNAKPQPVDDQPTIDAITEQVKAITAKVPS
jgi:hypothetical protein